MTVFDVESLAINHSLLVTADDSRSKCDNIDGESPKVCILLNTAFGLPTLSECKDTRTYVRLRKGPRLPTEVGLAALKLLSV